MLICKKFFLTSKQNDFVMIMTENCIKSNSPQKKQQKRWKGETAGNAYSIMQSND